MSQPTRVIQYGLGAIGRATAKLALEKSSLKLVGAVDQDPRFAGRDLGDVLELGRQLNIPVQPQFTPTPADAVFHCTGSSFAGVFDQFEAIAKAGLHCVTSCEEALFPAYRHKELAAKLDKLCAAHGVSLLGTGVNPGFVMDTLALITTAACQKVDSVHVTRIVDAGTRREALQRKVGAGLTEEEFHRLAKKQQIRHVGLSESLALVADGLGWNLDHVDETIAPVIAPKTIQTQFLTVKAGQPAGVRQIAHGFWQGRERITLDLQMYVGAPHPCDEIILQSVPPMHVIVHGGTAGDLATPAIMVNCLPRLMAAKPGLHTMTTIPLPRLIQ
jgi:4-hydroxy-tetrahydrodipicolinate reductase